MKGLRAASIHIWAVVFDLACNSSRNTVLSACSLAAHLLFSAGSSGGACPGSSPKNRCMSASTDSRLPGAVRFSYYSKPCGRVDGWGGGGGGVQSRTDTALDGLCHQAGMQHKQR